MTAAGVVESEGTGEEFGRQRKTLQEFKLPLAKTCRLRAARFIVHIVAITLQEQGKSKGLLRTREEEAALSTPPFASRPGLFRMETVQPSALFRNGSDLRVGYTSALDERLRDGEPSLDWQWPTLHRAPGALAGTQPHLPVRLHCGPEVLYWPGESD